MPELPRRKRFQIHLSTAIALIFVFGGLVWINLYWNTEVLERKNAPETCFMNSDTPNALLDFYICKYGWPLTAANCYKLVYQDGRVLIFHNESFVIHYFQAAFDLIIALLILVAIRYAFEWKNFHPRKRFQIHLSTALLLMFTTGALIQTNISASMISKERRGIRRDTWSATETISGRWVTYERSYGWPYVAINYQEFFESASWEKKDVSPRCWVSYPTITVDIFAAIIVFLSVWFTCEWWIDYRAWKKEA